MTKVPVSSAVLRWALERSGYPLSVRKKFPKYEEWLRGEDQPTLRQLEKFAQMTRTPLGYFFLSEPPQEKLPIPYFRTIGDERRRDPSPDLIETVQTMQQRQAWMREYLIEEGQGPLPFVGCARPTDNPTSIAGMIREALNLPQRWAGKLPNWKQALRYLQLKMEDAGILVVINSVVGNNTHRKLSVNEFRGFVLVDEYCPLVFVNGSDAKVAQMFTLAHELAHIWLGISAAFDLHELHPADNETERLCNRIAAEFLVPADEMKEFWIRVHGHSDRFSRVAREFKVSELVAARRALDLGLITKAEFVEFYRTILERERQDTDVQGGGDFYANQDLRIGRRFAEAVIRATREGRLLYRDAYRLTGLYGSTFEAYAARLESGWLT